MHTTICKIKRNRNFGKSSPPDRFYNLWKKVLEPRKSMRKEQKKITPFQASTQSLCTILAITPKQHSLITLFFPFSALCNMCLCLQ